MDLGDRDGWDDMVIGCPFNKQQYVYHRLPELFVFMFTRKDSWLLTVQCPSTYVCVYTRKLNVKG